MEEEARRIQEEDERLEREERERAAKRPRHQNLDLSTLGDELSSQELMSLTTTLEGCARAGQRENEARVYDFSSSRKEEHQVTELKTRFANMKIVSRAKVTNERVYSSLYHPEKVQLASFYAFLTDLL
jgi:WD repeat-containing protein 76